MLLATDLAVLDHHDGSVLLIANAINYDATDERVDDAYADAVRRLDAMQAEADEIMADTLHCFEDGAIEEGSLTAFSIALEQFHNAVADRKAVLVEMHEKPARSSRSHVA